MDSNCEFAEEIYDLTPLQVVQWIYIVTSATTIFLVIYTARSYLHRSIFQDVTKELIIALYVLITINSSCVLLGQGSTLAYRYLATTKCEAQSPRIWCVFKYIGVVITWSYVFLHLGITLQHALSSFLFGVRIQKIASRISIIISFLFSIICGVLAYSKDSLEGRSAYCLGFTKQSESILMFNLYLILVLDILNTLFSILLWRYNKRKFVDDRSFHRRQNLYAMQQFLPISLLNFIFYIVLFLTMFFSQALKSSMSPGWYIFTTVASSVQPYYCLLCPLIFLVLIRRGRFKRVSHVHAMINPEKNPTEESELNSLVLNEIAFSQRRNVPNVFCSHCTTFKCPSPVIKELCENGITTVLQKNVLRAQDIEKDLL